MDSSRTFLALRTSSRTHFEVLGLGLGLEAQVLGLKIYKSSKMSVLGNKKINKLLGIRLISRGDLGSI